MMLHPNKRALHRPCQRPGGAHQQKLFKATAGVNLLNPKPIVASLTDQRRMTVGEHPILQLKVMAGGHPPNQLRAMVGEQPQLLKMTVGGRPPNQRKAIAGEQLQPLLKPTVGGHLPKQPKVTAGEHLQLKMIGAKEVRPQRVPRVLRGETLEGRTGQTPPPGSSLLDSHRKSPQRRLRPILARLGR